MRRLQRLSSWATTPAALPAWLGLAALVGGIYLVTAKVIFGHGGFPLDDAWIHQTYARSLAHTGQFAFTAGETSAGSTAPLWTLVLSLGYLLRLPFTVWTFGLGIAGLGLTGWSGARLSRRLWPESPSWLWLGIGLFLVVEWHLTWAAVSGMETILFVWLSILLVERYLAWQDRLQTSSVTSLVLGLLGGFLTLTRPEGIGLVGLIGLEVGRRWWASPERRWSDLARAWGSLGLGLVIPILPYALFNLNASGLLLPNTFYAKQREYGILLAQRTFWQRWLAVSGVTLVGAQALLLPGLVATAGLALRQRRGELWFVWCWWLGFLALYAWRLPVTYQHGRYEMPAIPWLVILGLWGTKSILRTQARRLLPRVLSRAWLLALAILAVAFVAVGAQAYARDVRIIDTEMVAAARWLRDNTAPEATVAVHDIGAVGYFTRQPLLDLAGLLSPEVVPFIRDEAQLLEYVRRRQARYLVTFPSWYPNLVTAPDLRLIYSTGAPWAPAAGGDNMAVYQFASP